MSSQTSFSPAFEAFAADVSAAAIAQQDALNDFLGGDHRSVDLNARTLTGGGQTLTGVTCLGSFSHMDHSWLWMWSNPNFTWEHPAVAPLRGIYDIGHRHGIIELTTGELDFSGFPDPHQAATTLAIASAYLLGGHGMWSCRINEGRGSAYVHIDDAQLPVARFDPVTAPRLLMTAAQVWPAQQVGVVRGFLRHHGMAGSESHNQIVGRHPSGTEVVVQFDEYGRITAANLNIGGSPQY